MMRRAFAILLALAVFPATAAAQMCTGNAPIGARSSSSAVHGGADFPTGGTGYGVGFTMGSDYLFSAGFGYVAVDNTDLSLKTLSAGGAYQMGLGESGVVMCPRVTVGYGFGLEFLGLDVNTWTVNPATAVAYPVAVSPSFAVVPFGQLGLQWEHATIDLGAEGDESVSDTYGLLDFGLSMLFNDMFSVGPTLRIPLGLDGAEEMWGITASFGIGR